jgi:hypothetical protein
MDHIIANFIEQPIGGYKFLVLLDAHPIPPSQLVEHRIDGQIFSGRRRAWRLRCQSFELSPAKEHAANATFCFLAAEEHPFTSFGPSNQTTSLQWAAHLAH